VKFSSLTGYRNHLDSIHHVPSVCDSVEKTFGTREEFMSWKADEEKKDTAKFVMKSGASTTSSGLRSVYFCNRSGHYVSQSAGKRQIKSQGSSRSGQSCPASMIVNERGSLFTATYFPTHYGHEKKLCHLTLASSERQQIAGKLLQGVPPSRILQDIRTSLTSDVERVHLTSRQDISNVKNLFGITVSGTSEVVQTRMSDATSVHAWVQSCQALGSTNPVLLYKQQGEEFAGLHKDDFALLIMTPVQKLMLEKFGNDRICVDSTHGMTGHDFELTSFLVIDEFEEGFSAVFLLSPCTDARTLAV